MVFRRVLLIGDHRHREFSTATTWLANHTFLSIAATPTDALAALQHPAPSPELVVVAQGRPSQFAQEQIEMVHRLAPLARLVVLAGSWCEGEMRTGHPWPGVIRLYWHQGEARLREMLAETSPRWSHPRTFTEVERLLEQPAPRATGGQKLIAIGTETSLAYHGLAATCAQAGFATAWVAPRQWTMIQGAAAGIWDESQYHPSQSADWQSADWKSAESPEPLREFTRHVQDAPIVALVNFPRQSDFRRLQDAGIRQIIAKPFMNTDLIGVIQQQLGATAGGQKLAVA